MSDNVIQVKNLHKDFKIKIKNPGFFSGFKSLFKPEYKEVKAVDGISFTVEEGEILAFIGPNGAGKSTTIKMMTGILYPTSGEINVLGFNPATDRQELSYYVGSVFGQKPQLWYHLPPMDTYNLLARIYELDETAYQERLTFLIKSFEIADLLKIPVRKLSLGQRMRCEIVASLIHRPKIIFLDEPTIGLDVIAKQNIREVIKYLNQVEKVTIFLTSHDAGDIEALADRSIVINDGRVIFDDYTAKLKKDFIKNKVIELVLDEPTDNFNFPEGKVIERGRFNLKIELDTLVTPIERLLVYATENFSIKDINIFDTPMEEIIAEIYRAQKHGA
ncbi:MAG: ATP-binding cassette domain-containing protein [bacterium]